MVIQTAKRLYYSNQIIFESEKDKENYRKHNVFYDFMQMDDRTTLTHYASCNNKDHE